MWCLCWIIRDESVSQVGEGTEMVQLISAKGTTDSLLCLGQLQEGRGVGKGNGKHSKIDWIGY
jgi:hypothetical protein